MNSRNKYALDFESIVIHEAGHATVALHCGVRIRWILIEECRREVGYPKGSVTPVIAMAGWVAEQIAQGSLARIPNWRRRFDDVSAHVDISRFVIKRELSHDSVLSREEKLQIVRAGSAARAILRKRWAFVSQLCAMIDSATHTPGKDIQRLWNSYLKRPIRPSQKIEMP